MKYQLWGRNIQTVRKLKGMKEYFPYGKRNLTVFEAGRKAERRACSWAV